MGLTVAARGRPRKTKELTDQAFIKLAIKVEMNVSELARQLGSTNHLVKKRLDKVSHLRATPQYPGQLHRQFEPTMLLEFLPACLAPGVARINVVHTKSKEYKEFLRTCVEAGEIICFAGTLWVCCHEDKCPKATNDPICEPQQGSDQLDI